MNAVPLSRPRLHWSGDTLVLVEFDGEQHWLPASSITGERRATGATHLKHWRLARRGARGAEAFAVVRCDDRLGADDQRARAIDMDARSRAASAYLSELLQRAMAEREAAMQAAAREV